MRTLFNGILVFLIPASIFSGWYFSLLFFAPVTAMTVGGSATIALAFAVVCYCILCYYIRESERQYLYNNAFMLLAQRYLEKGIYHACFAGFCGETGDWLIFEMRRVNLKGDRQNGTWTARRKDEMVKYAFCQDVHHELLSACKSDSHSRNHEASQGCFVVWENGQLAFHPKSKEIICSWEKKPDIPTREDAEKAMATAS